MNRHTSAARAHDTIWLWLLMMALLYAAFFVLRYGGLWIENDTGVFSRQAAQLIHRGSIFFPGVYNHGFAYTAWLSGLALATGVNPATFNTEIMPFFGIVLLVIPGYLAFNELLASKRMAALGAILLVTIPDITFSALRGTHEKLSMAFVCTGLYCLFKLMDTVTNRNRPRMLLWASLFLLVEFLNAGTNDYFASTFTFALTLTLGVGYILSNLRRVPTEENWGQTLRILGLCVLAAWLINLWVIFVVFPPEAQDLLLIRGALAKMSHLFTTLQPGSNPYTLASSLWASNAAFEIMNIFRWFILLVSGLMWGINVYQVLVRRQRLEKSRLLLISTYTAFALLVGASIPLDFSGLAAGTNLEVRNFTYVILLGIPLVAEAIYRVTHTQRLLRLGVLNLQVRKIARPTVIATMCILLLVGFLKVTLDPLVSNYWLFYTPQEAQALHFFWDHNRNQTLWTGPDDRLAFYAHSRLIANPKNNNVIGFEAVPFTYEYLYSPLVRSSDLVLRFPIFDYQANNRVYDNGGAQIYRVRSRSPFVR